MQKTSDSVGYISTVDEKRETLGTQIMRAGDAFLNAPYKQEAGETLSELGKDICRNLEGIINKARDIGFRGCLFIQMLELPMPDHLGLPCVHIKFYGRATRPSPIWNSSLYAHHEGDNCPTLLYCLPRIQDHQEILKNPNKYTPNTVFWTRLMLNGLLF